MVNFEAVKKLLESQGKLDFKPFHFDNAKQEYWAYRTNDNKFHICDSDLKEIDRYDFKKILVKDWECCELLVVMDTEQDYSFLKEGLSVTKIQEEQPENLIKNVWIINDWDGEIMVKDFHGYKYIGKKWIIFETETIEISNNEQNYWVPNRKIACYNPSNLRENKTFYCGTYNDYSDLFYSEGYYYMECRYLCGGEESRPNNFENLFIWFNNDGILLIDIFKKKGINVLEIFKHAVIEETPSSYNFSQNYIIDECLGSYDISIYFNSKEANYFANKNVFVVSSYRPYLSSWMTIDRYGNVGSIVNGKKGKILSVFNDVIKLDHSVCDIKEKTCDFYDYKGKCIAKDVNKDAHFVVVSKSFNSALFEDGLDSDMCNLITLKGILNTQDHKLVVPIKYTNLELFDGGDFFYAIIGEEYTDRTGTKAIQYGLLYNNNIILPCNKVEIKSLSENLFRWEEGEKYGLVSNGRVCCDHIYSKILVASSEGASREFDHYGYLGAVYKYKKYKYACVYDGDKCGVFVPDRDMFIPPKYKDCTVFVEEQFILADGILYSTLDGNLTFVKDVTKYDYIGALCCYHLFREKESLKNKVNSYICVHLKDGKLSEEDVIDAKYDHNIEDDCKSDIDWRNYSPILSIGCSSVFYSVKEECFEDDINFFSSCSEPDIDPDEGYNYERDTYYALGGDDYDRWKENGGDLDGMMEGMGF